MKGFEARSVSAGAWAILALLVALATASAVSAAEPFPEYPHGAFRADCRTCHSPDSWSPAQIRPEFDHSAYGFPLAGAHEGTPCLLCHLTLEFDTVSGNTCAECHQDVHRGEFGVDCQQCHTTRSFVDRGDEIRNHRLTRFPLTGMHLVLECVMCHEAQGGAGMVFTTARAECIACHRDEFVGTRNPDHVSSGIPEDCASCHTTASWGGGRFDHSLTAFPLTGSHQGAECQSCHVNNQFAGTPTDCYSCHQTEYASTTSPNHLSAGFRTSCESCHNTTQWEGATFDHDALFFPIYSGAHREKWTSCADCHTNETNYSLFTCLECHEHRRSEMDDKHHEVGGYSYESNACYSCHPRGRS